MYPDIRTNQQSGNKEKEDQIVSLESSEENLTSSSGSAAGVASGSTSGAGAGGGRGRLNSPDGDGEQGHGPSEEGDGRNDVVVSQIGSCGRLVPC